MKNEQTSIFDLAKEERIDIKENVLQVIQAKMVCNKGVTWQELFEGFDEMYVITFSTGIEFTLQLLDKFKYSEIIYGCEAVLPPGISAVMAVETEMISKIVKNSSAIKLSQKIDEGKLKLLISRDTRLHEKVYCLRANDGRTRVVTGSANMSASAFCGIQRENIIYFDDETAFNYYYSKFKMFSEECSDEVTKQTVEVAENLGNGYLENAEDFPIIQNLQKKGAIYLEPSDAGTDEEEKIIAEIKGHEEELRKIMPKPRFKGEKIFISVEDLMIVKKKQKESIENIKRIKRENPKLHINYMNKTLSFNDHNMDLFPSKEDVKKDALCIKEFIDGIGTFGEDSDKAQRNYYLFLNWCLCSPFMAYMRMVASKNGYETIRFPVIGMIYGDSNGGKSTFFKLLDKLMCGRIIPANRNEDFSYSRINALKTACEGLPIYIDDLAKTQFQNNHEKIIKDDEWGIQENFINYPAIAISTNRVPSITNDISKRIVTCKINVGINNEQCVKNSKKVNDLIKQASTSLFCRYVNRMIDIVLELEEDIKNNKSHFVDILKESANVLKDIMKESLGKNLPKYMDDIDYFSYFGEKAIAENAINKIVRAWESEPERFKVNKKKNILIYSGAADSRYYLKTIADELPRNLDAKLNVETLTMNLKEAQILFACKFRRGIFGKIK